MFRSGANILHIMIFAIPLVAIIGGIVAGIVKTLGQQRLIELAQRERIVALERGVDPSKLPPLPMLGGHEDLAAMYLSPRQMAQQRAQRLMVAGVITLSAGIGVTLMLNFLPGREAPGVWAVGLVPTCVGLGLLVASTIVSWTVPEDDRRPGPHA